MIDVTYPDPKTEAELHDFLTTVTYLDGVIRNLANEWIREVSLEKSDFRVESWSYAAPEKHVRVKYRRKLTTGQMEEFAISTEIGIDIVARRLDLLAVRDVMRS